MYTNGRREVDPVKVLQDTRDRLLRAMLRTNSTAEYNALVGIYHRVGIKLWRALQEQDMQKGKAPRPFNGYLKPNKVESAEPLYTFIEQ